VEACPAVKHSIRSRKKENVVIVTDLPVVSRGKGLSSYKKPESGEPARGAISAPELAALVRRLWSAQREEERVGGSDDSMLDILDLYDRSGNSIRRTKLIISAFLTSYGEQLERLILSGAHEADRPAVSDAAHALKGLLLDVGAAPLAKIAEQVELCYAKPSTSSEQVAQFDLIISDFIEQVRSLTTLLAQLEQEL